jgi:transcription elongation factor Elf1
MNEHECERCGEVNTLDGIALVEHTDGTGEVVCKLCLENERQTEMELALFGSLD